MPTLNANIPHIECYVRKPFLYDLDDEKEGLVKAVAFGVSSITGRALGFHVMLDNGAVIWRLPIHALCHKVAIDQPLDHLQLWDCFSYEVSVCKFDFLDGSLCDVFLKDKKPYRGTYLFTVDWHGSSIAEAPGDLGHKCAHIIALDTGNYTAQPNNRIRWHSPAFASPFDKPPDYKTNSHIWRCEGLSKWETTDQYFYDLETDADTPRNEGSIMDDR